jgi:hypothetical protein
VYGGEDYPWGRMNAAMKEIMKNAKESGSVGESN